MKPVIGVIDPSHPDSVLLEKAVDALKRSEVIVCPTDTGYAFSANALDIKAIAHVFNLKGRSFNHPIHIAVNNIDEAEKYAQVNEAARFLANRYLPGALTIVMKRRDTIPSLLVAGMDTIGVRIPDNQVIMLLTEMTGFPLTTTSANISGKPGAYNIEEMQAQLGAELKNIAVVLDQGAISSKEVSTVVDISLYPPQLIRQGKISWIDIREGLKRFDPPDTGKKG